MKKLKTPTAVTTAVLTLITIFFWAGFEVYRSLTVKPVPPVPAEIINPITPSLDTKTLNSLNQRIFLTDDQIGNTTGTTAPISTVTPTLTPSPIPSSSPSATIAPIASASATPSTTPTATP